MLLAVQKTTPFKRASPDREIKMSRQHKMALAMMNGQNQIRPIARTVASRRILGHVISLNEDDKDSQQPQTCIHVSDRNDELVVHIRKFKNGLPTQNGVAYDHEGWWSLTKLMPILDNFVNGVDSCGVQKALFALDADRSVMVLNCGSENVQVIFQRENNNILLSRDQWMNFVRKQDYIKIKIMDHMAVLISKIEAQG